MDLSHLTFGVVAVLISVLVAEASNGWTDAPCATSSAVASGILTSRRALWITVLGNFAGLLAALFIGAKVAKTIGTGIVRPDIISIASIGIAMLTIIAWALITARIGFPVSKTHSLLAALAGIGYAQGGLAALLPVSGNWHDSGWVKAAIGAFIAIVCGAAIAWFLTRLIVSTGLSERVSVRWWRRLQLLTVCAVSTGHGFNDGLKYVGIFTLVLFISGVIPAFTVMPWVIVLCAFVMGIGTMIGGKRIHKRLHHLVNHTHDEVSEEKQFKPYMGVASEATSAFLILQTGWLGIPTSTNHATVSSMAGARSATGKVHTGSLVIILWGWVITYIFCFWVANTLSMLFL